MGEKPRNKGSEKTPKAPKRGVRPHEQREQESAFKPSETSAKPSSDRKAPKT
jgi:hypothetical protein